LKPLEKFIDLAQSVVFIKIFLNELIFSLTIIYMEEVYRLRLQIHIAVLLVQ